MATPPSNAPPKATSAELSVAGIADCVTTQGGILELDAFCTEVWPNYRAAKKDAGTAEGETSTPEPATSSPPVSPEDVVAIVSRHESTTYPALVRLIRRVAATTTRGSVSNDDACTSSGTQEDEEHKGKGEAKASSSFWLATPVSVTAAVSHGTSSSKVESGQRSASWAPLEALHASGEPGVHSPLAALLQSRSTCDERPKDLAALHSKVVTVASYYECQLQPLAPKALTVRSFSLLLCRPQAAQFVERLMDHLMPNTLKPLWRSSGGWGLEHPKRREILNRVKWMTKTTLPAVAEECVSAAEIVGIIQGIEGSIRTLLEAVMDSVTLPASLIRFGPSDLDRVLSGVPSGRLALSNAVAVLLVEVEQMQQTATTTTTATAAAPPVPLSGATRKGPSAERANAKGGSKKSDTNTKKKRNPPAAAAPPKPVDHPTTGVASRTILTASQPPADSTQERDDGGNRSPRQEEGIDEVKEGAPEPKLAASDERTKQEEEEEPLSMEELEKSSRPPLDEEQSTAVAPTSHLKESDAQAGSPPPSALPRGPSPHEASSVGFEDSTPTSDLLEKVLRAADISSEVSHTKEDPESSATAALLFTHQLHQWDAHRVRGRDPHQGSLQLPDVRGTGRKRSQTLLPRAASTTLVPVTLRDSPYLHTTAPEQQQATASSGSTSSALDDAPKKVKKRTTLPPLRRGIGVKKSGADAKAATVNGPPSVSSRAAEEQRSASELGLLLESIVASSAVTREEQLVSQRKVQAAQRRNLRHRQELKEFIAVESRQPKNLPPRRLH